jgi:hypothetical protein
MYRVNKVEDLYFILLGYELKMYESKKKSTETEKYSTFKTNFRKFVNKKCGSKKDHETVSLIRLHSGGSDKHSLELFKQWFLEYLKQE